MVIELKQNIKAQRFILIKGFIVTAIYILRKQRGNDNGRFYKFPGLISHYLSHHLIGVNFLLKSPLPGVVLIINDLHWIFIISSIRNSMTCYCR